MGGSVSRMPRSDPDPARGKARIRIVNISDCDPKPMLEFRNISWGLKSLDLICQTGSLASVHHVSPEMVLVN
jgi:hypothetical protein